MAKRFTDTDKWKKQWYRKLGSRLRDVRQFVLDDCDLAGIWEVDLERIGYHVGGTVAIEEVRAAFKGELFTLDGGSRIFIPAFIEFQYGTLTQSCNAHRAVIKRLTLMGCLTLLGTLPGRDQDKDKNQDKDKDQDKNQDKDSSGPPVEFKELRDRLREKACMGSSA